MIVSYPLTPTAAALFLIALAVFLCWHELRALRSRLGPRTIGQRYAIWQGRREEERIKRLKAAALANRSTGAKPQEVVIGMQGNVVQTQRRSEKPRKL